MSRGNLGRADLIRCWDQMDEARFRRVAEALGYQEEPEPAAELKAVVGSTASATVTIPPPTLSAEGVRHRHYRLVERRTLAPPPPPSPVELPPPNKAEPVAPLGPSPPLMPWPRLWPFLRAALGEQAERHRIDLRRLVAAVARRRPPRRLPRLKGLRWAPQGHLILDLHPRLYPFWNDFHALKTALPRLRGAIGLDILCMTQGPAVPVRRWEGQSWGAHQPYVPPPPGTPVLIAGDLGCLGTEEQWRPWASLGRRLAARGIFPVALTPCPARWWNPALAGLFYPVVLDRTARVPPRPAGPRPWPARAANVGEEAGRDAGAKLLLTLLSACIGITPALLRHLRHALPVEQADVGSEAAAWLHPAFRPGDFALLPGDVRAVEPFRQAFRELDPDTRHLAWNLIRAQQREVSLAVRMEEHVLYAALEGRTDSEAEAFLDRVAAVLKQVPEHDAMAEQVRFLRGWVNRCGRRMHPAAWDHSPRSEALWVLANPEVADEGGALPVGLDIHRALAALDRPEQPQTWRLIQRGERFEVEAATHAERAYASGSPIADFSTRRPMMQFNEGRSGAADASQPLEDNVGLPVNETGYRLTTDSDELVIEPFSRPPWAHTLGRDGDGLFVGFRDGRGERRAYWWNPGRVLWLYPDGRELGAVELKTGFFVDESLFRAWRAEGLRVPAWADQAGVDEYGVFAAFNVGGVAQRARWIWPGSFWMGSPKDEHDDRFDNELQHEVLLTRGFWLAETACTQALWRAVKGNNPSYFEGEWRPVEQVSWNKVQNFIERLNGAIPRLEARLPTEAEWEYACRAGTTTPFSFGENITPEQVNYNANSPYRGNRKGKYRKKTIEVASLPANPWGLYEMHGNVREWCQDRYGDYPEGLTVDPTGPVTGEKRVLRGGSWIGGGRKARSAYRSCSVQDAHHDHFGFRLALGPELRQGGRAGPAGRK
ncbi:MAG TPA: formylglycine-generating enzyme family protein [Candidatus Competibacter phosphatis]|nr:formylglycine-generating enzyme family protein [Candidatus Competibacter phosphatis]